MPLYWIIDRTALIVAMVSSSAFLLMQKPEVAIAALTIWPLTRALISVIDVFFVFFTDKPLVRTSRFHPALTDPRAHTPAE